MAFGSFGVSEEHRALAESVEGWASRHAPPTVVRDAFEAQQDVLPAFWPDLAAQGLLGLHVAEEHGGAGYGPVETAVALERLGAALTPGPLLPTMLASLLLDRHGPAPLAKELLPSLVDGSAVAATATTCGSVTARRDGDDLILDGTVPGVWGAAVADHLVLGARDGDDEHWLVVPAAHARIEARHDLDATRRVAAVHVDGLRIDAGRRLGDLDETRVRDIAATLAAAEASGVAAWCLATAVEHAQVREQFGRPIGQFQAVKHLCAQMLVRVEQARATAWDAAHALDDDAQRPLAAAVATATCLEAAVDNAKDAIQILGGIGYTWEHDAHFYLRRATATRAMLGPAAEARVEAARRALAGERRNLSLDLPEEQAGSARAQVRAFLEEITDLDEDERRRRIADEGYLAPHWPRPWGRDADPIEQLVIAEEFATAGVEIPDIVIGKWILPTIINHGTREQQERFVPPTFRGELVWCQMFSEPGAGSDLASLTTRAERTHGGWLLTGQKVWTSLAHEADYGMCLARTNPDAPKHKGITAFLLDMSSPGIEIRPLTEITGRDLFNEIFLTEVFVPDENVVGEVDDGWRAARTTLANERVEMSTGSTMGRGVEGVLAVLGDHPASDDRIVLERTGGLVCEGQTLALLGFRTTLARLGGVDPGASSSVRKLVGMGHAQAASEYALELVGPEGATPEGEVAGLAHAFIQTRSLTIAGGTTQVLRNVIGERILGLPRDDA